MRQVNLRVRADVQDDVEAVLEEHDLDYLAIRDDGDEEAGSGTLFLSPLPSEAVSNVFHDLTDAGVSEDAYNVLVNASHVETPSYEETRKEYSQEIRALSRRELHSKVLNLQWPRLTYYLGTIMSVLVATAGLLLDSPAVLVGSMVIAPQVTSALSAVAGVIHGDWKMFLGSARRQGIALPLAVACAAAFTWLVRWGGFIPATTAVPSLELMGLRLAPTALSSVAALIAGAVGAFGYMTDQTTSLVGVMIAAAIIPAAAAAGIAVAWGVPLVAAGAAALLAVNMLAINVGAMATLLLIGYRPVWVDRTDLDTSLPASGRATVGAVALLFGLLIVATGALVGFHVGYEQSVNGAVDETFTEPQYSDLTLVSTSSQFRGWSGSTPNVTVTVHRSANQSYPSLSTTLERRIEERTGRNVRVTVRYAESRSSESLARPAVPRGGRPAAAPAAQPRSASPSV
jgi:uncharacterized hydrophobic protein (TIGR00271 family)